MFGFLPGEDRSRRQNQEQLQNLLLENSPRLLRSGTVRRQPLDSEQKNQRFDFRDLNFDAENYVQLNDNYRVESDNELDVENLLENPDNFENKEIGENLNVENARPAKNLIVEPVENFNIVDNVENLT